MGYFYLIEKIYPQELILTLRNGTNSIPCKTFLTHETESTDKVVLSTSSPCLFHSNHTKEVMGMCIYVFKKIRLHLDKCKIFISKFVSVHVPCPP